MFKNLKYILASFVLLQSVALANYNDIYIADIQYDWINKSEVEKEAIISEIHDIMFKEDFQKQSDFRSQFKDKLKDKEWKKHYYAASAGYKDIDNYNLSAFYANNKKYIYMYALQDKADLSKAYYYSAMGKLYYVDFINGEYPDYPYYSYQYQISGKPVSAIYFVSKDTQYLFEPNGEFKGVWYKHNLYDKHSKIILKRSSY
ncbi:MAG: hypothetical protein MJ231_07815 [bacterium]|nr:hypothetical protein [bacterium]